MTDDHEGDPISQAYLRERLHQLNNELQPIIGLGEVTKRRLAKNDTEAAQDHLDTIMESARNAAVLVGEIHAHVRGEH